MSENQSLESHPVSNPIPSSDLLISANGASIRPVARTFQVILTLLFSHSLSTRQQVLTARPPKQSLELSTYLHLHCHHPGPHPPDNYSGTFLVLSFAF